MVFQALLTVIVIVSAIAAWLYFDRRKNNQPTPIVDYLDAKWNEVSDTGSGGVQLWHELRDYLAAVGEEEAGAEFLDKLKEIVANQVMADEE